MPPHTAIAEVDPLHLWGRPAWLIWLGVHIAMLIGFEHRLLVLLQWTWSFFTHHRGARVIARPWSASGSRTAAIHQTRRRA